MGQALYRKYRPKKLSEIVGEEHITSTLSNALKSDQISHAYLFTGPRGVGKTSVARILAHEINGFEYADDQDYLDIIEIDAASNRRIDEIRELRDKVNIAPTTGKYKVYIIDEVHMLTREAFNALLKTLEEPPAHAIFILATTEAYKVPETIVSRTQQFNFRPISTAQIISQLKDIAKKEKIVIDNAALDIIAEYGQGSFRDSISLLDQASSISQKITENDLEVLLGMAPSKIINNLIVNIENGQLSELSETLEKIDENGYNITVVCKQLNLQLKNVLLNNSSHLSSEEILGLMKQVVDVPSSSDSTTSLEIILFKAALKQRKSDDKPTSENVLEDKKEVPVVMKKTEIEEIVSDKIEPLPAMKESKTKKPSNLKINNEVWKQLLDTIKIKYNTLYGIMRMAVPEFKSDSIILTTKFDFHKRLLNDPKNQLIIIETIRDITGNETEIRAVVNKDIELESRDERAKELVEVNESLSNINNIFGSSEVVE